MSKQKAANPDCPECGGTGDVLEWFWADGDRQMSERYDCPVCYPVNQVPFIVTAVAILVLGSAAIIAAGVWSP